MYSLSYTWWDVPFDGENGKICRWDIDGNEMKEERDIYYYYGVVGKISRFFCCRFLCRRRRFRCDVEVEELF